METPTFSFALREDLKDKTEYLPSKTEPLATGWDVRCAEDSDQIIFPNYYIKIRLGFRVFAPHGWWLELRPRSSSFAKKSLHALYGVIDEAYENEVIFAAQYIPADEEIINDISYNKHIRNDFRPNTLRIKPGERIGQILPVRRQEMQVNHLSNEEFDNLCKQRNAQRGTGGFGSSGDK